jgi:HNH endonuclease
MRGGCLEWVLLAFGVLVSQAVGGDTGFVLGILTVLAGAVFVGALSGASSRRYAPAAKRSRSIPQDVKIAVAVRDQGRCQHCGTSAGPMQYDHVIPYSVGGDNSVNNIQLLCRRCNAAKSNRYVG